MASLSNFLREERGATAIEYALIGSLISIMIVAGLIVLGPAVASMFQSAADGFPVATATAGS